jgi:peptidoglycan/xylan/chitin deacetylase (PgdA/CDA1 family)
MYHGFCDEAVEEDPYFLLVPRQHLTDHLRDVAPTALDLDGFLRASAGRPSRPRGHLVTIDDGYRSVLHVGAETFARAGVAPLLFVPPALITDPPVSGRDGMGAEPLLTPDELRQLIAHGFEIGVHGLDHSTMIGLSDAELRRQTLTARDDLADITGVRARAFAYPLGIVDSRAADAVRSAGYDVAFSVSADLGRWGVPRVGIAPADSGTAFRFKLSPWYDVAWRVTKPLTGMRRRVRPALQLLDRGLRSR